MPDLEIPGKGKHNVVRAVVKRFFVQTYLRPYRYLR
jgi:hypothetical protein